MNHITEKYPSQLTRPRELESPETIHRLKKEKEFQSSTVNDLTAMHYCCGYDVLADSDNSKILLFSTKLEQKKDSNILYVDKYAPTFFIKKGYQSGDIFIVSPDFYNNQKIDGSYRRERYINHNKKIDIHNRILKHTFSYELCSNKKEKNIEKAISVAGENSCILTEEQKHNAYLISRTIGFSIRPSSSAYVIDIDSKNEKDAIKASNTLKKIFEVNGADSILFIEQSLSGAYHVVVRFGDFKEGITKQQYHAYIDYMNQNILSDQDVYMKLDKFSNGIRCLFSSTYAPINYDPSYPGCLGEIHSSIFEALKDFNYKYNTSEKYFKYPSIEHTEQKNVKVDLTPEVEKSLYKKKTKITSRIFNSNHYDRRSSSAYTGKKTYIIKEGERFSTQTQMIPHYKALGMSKDEVWNEVQKSNVGCRAQNHMSKWRREVDSYYDKISLPLNPKEEFMHNAHITENTYISQEQYIPDHIKKKISDHAFIVQILHKVGRKSSDNNIEIFKRILLEMYGTFYYDVLHPKKLKGTSKKSFQVGAQFAKSTCDLMQNQFPILNNTDVYISVRSILKDTSLFSKFNNHTFVSINNPNNKCSQWTLSVSDDIFYSIDTLSSYIKRSYNRMIYTIKHALKSIKKFLVIDNRYIVSIFEKIFNKNQSIGGLKYILDH